MQRVQLTQPIEHSVNYSHSDIPSFLSPQSILSLDSTHSLNDEELSQFRHRMRNQSTLKQKVRKFSVTLHKSDTLLRAIVTKLCKSTSFPLSISKKYLIAMAILQFILVIGDYTLNDYIWLSIEYNIAIKVPFLVTVTLFILNCNAYIFKQSLQSFIVWYKTINATIGMFARIMYYDAFIQYWSNGKITSLHAENQEMVRACIATSGLGILSSFIGVFTLALLDGYATKGNKIKRVFMIVGITLIQILYFELYFNIYDYNVNKSMTINFGNNVQVSLFWRDIAMTSLFKANVFFVAQVYHNLRHPQRLNVVPLPAIIEQTSLTAEYLNNANANISGDTTVYVDENEKENKNKKTNYKNKNKNKNKDKKNNRNNQKKYNKNNNYNNKIKQWKISDRKATQKNSDDSKTQRTQNKENGDDNSHVTTVDDKHNGDHSGREPNVSQPVTIVTNETGVDPGQLTPPPPLSSILNVAFDDDDNDDENDAQNINPIVITKPKHTIVVSDSQFDSDPDTHTQIRLSTMETDFGSSNINTNMDNLSIENSACAVGTTGGRKKHSNSTSIATNRASLSSLNHNDEMMIRTPSMLENIEKIGQGRERSKGYNFDTHISQFKLTVPVEYTVSFVLYQNICKLETLRALRYSQMLFNMNFQICLAIIAAVASILRYVLREVNTDITLLFLDSCILLAFVITLLNLNYKIFKFRMRSVVNLWKTANIIIMWTAIYYLEYKFERGEFNKEQYSFNASIVNVILAMIGWCFAAQIVHLIQGYFVSKRYKLATILLIIVWTLRRAIYHYFNQSYDDHITFLGNKINLRTLIFVKGIDVTIWFTYQFVQILADSQRLNLVCKVRVYWVS